MPKHTTDAMFEFLKKGVRSQHDYASNSFVKLIPQKLYHAGTSSPEMELFEWLYDQVLLHIRGSELKVLTRSIFCISGYSNMRSREVAIITEILKNCLGERLGLLGTKPLMLT